MESSAYKTIDFLEVLLIFGGPTAVAWASQDRLGASLRSCIKGDTGIAPHASGPHGSLNILLVWGPGGSSPGRQPGLPKKSNGPPERK